MPRYLIEEPTPFADAEEWLSFRDALARLPSEDPDVAAALRHADEVLATMGFSRSANSTWPSGFSGLTQLVG